jgi:hypothetical protein
MKMAAKKKTAPETKGPNLYEVVTGSVLMILGGLAERFVVAHEKLADRTSRLVEIVEKHEELDEFTMVADAFKMLGDSVENLHRDAMHYADYDKTRSK